MTITATGPTWGKRPPAPTQTVTRTNVFTVKVKNPCYLPDTIKYTSRLDLPLAVNYAFAASASTYNIVPTAHTQFAATKCNVGGSYEIKYNGVLVSDSTSPVKTTSNSLDNLSI